jgi:hypothetical protein
MAAVGQGATRWLDDGSEHPHRIALMVQERSVPDVSQRLAQGCAAAGVQARPNVAAGLSHCRARAACGLHACTILACQLTSLVPAMGRATCMQGAIAP